MDSPVLEFTRTVLQTAGALIEMEGEQQLNAVLPQAIAQQLQVPEYLQLSSDPSLVSDQVQLLNHESPLLSSLEPLISAHCRCVITAADPAPYLKTQGLGALINQQFIPHHFVMRVQEPRLVSNWYTQTYWRYRAKSDDNKEGIYRLIQNLHTGNTLGYLHPEPTSMMSWRYFQTMIEAEQDLEHPILSRLNPGLLYQKCCRQIEPDIQSALTYFKAVQQRRFDRDAQRLNAYYSGLELTIYILIL